MTFKNDGVADRLYIASMSRSSAPPYCDWLHRSRALWSRTLENTEPDHYATLGLDRRCTTAQIRSAYRVLSKRHHPDVWDVKNEPMAGAPDGGTLPGLAAQRVAGKPFLCTEYNHPAPNTYSAETFPLLCAFAALQDWDGVFAFS